jgi:hypothetical protein
MQPSDILDDSTRLYDAVRMRFARSCAILRMRKVFSVPHQAIHLSNGRFSFVAAYQALRGVEADIFSASGIVPGVSQHPFRSTNSHQVSLWCYAGIVTRVHQPQHARLKHVLGSLATKTGVQYIFAPHVKTTPALWTRFTSSQAAITTKLRVELTHFGRYAAQPGPRRGAVCRRTRRVCQLLWRSLV